MRWLITVGTAIGLLMLKAVCAGEQISRLNLVVVEGEGSINNIRQRTARECVVQVEDENHKPIAGAIVVFTLPDLGAGGTFPNAGKTLMRRSDSLGRATAHTFRANSVTGKFEIHVSTSFHGETATAAITQTNTLLAGAVAAGGISAKLIAVLIVAGAATAGGAVAATRSGGGSSVRTPPVPSASITIGGSVSIGPPH
jgi:hypothetical protein